MKALAIVRDVVVIAGLALVCYMAIDMRNMREYERTVRLLQVQQAIERLDTAYKLMVFDSTENKGIYQQIFRQNEIAMEYQKLALLRDLTSLDTVHPPSPSNIPPPTSK